MGYLQQGRGQEDTAVRSEHRLVHKAAGPGAGRWTQFGATAARVADRFMNGPNAGVRRTSVLAAAFCLFIFTCVATKAVAQGSTAQISGTVHDITGAAIPGTVTRPPGATATIAE